MELFSQKYGYKPVKTVIQLDGIDQDMRNGLWNTLDTHYWWHAERRSHTLEGLPALYHLGLTLSENYFKKPLDTMPTSTQAFKQEVREYFFNCRWYEVYDFIQFIVNNHQDSGVNRDFVAAANTILKREVSGYRFVGRTITRITEEEEIAEIEEVLTYQDSLLFVATHIQRALSLISDRKSPDYRNSIKESISAVESICKLITNKDKASLSQAIKVIADKIELHSDLKESFYKLYGYTSDADGIRHSLMEKPDLDFEDAKFMLVTCSAFVNYLKVKADKAGIKLDRE